MAAKIRLRLLETAVISMIFSIIGFFVGVVSGFYMGKDSEWRNQNANQQTSNRQPRPYSTYYSSNEDYYNRRKG